VRKRLLPLTADGLLRRLPRDVDATPAYLWLLGEPDRRLYVT
jgi:hypothetical protein